MTFDDAIHVKKYVFFIAHQKRRKEFFFNDINSFHKFHIHWGISVGLYSNTMSNNVLRNELASKLLTNFAQKKRVASTCVHSFKLDFN